MTLFIPSRLGLTGTKKPAMEQGGGSWRKRGEKQRERDGYEDGSVSERREKYIYRERMWGQSSGEGDVCGQ